MCLPKSIDPAHRSGHPIQTNKFYSNLYLGNQRQPNYLLPYTVAFNGKGLDIGHTDAGQLCYGPDPVASTAQYCFAPVGIVSLAVGALEATTMHLKNPEHFGVDVNLACPTGCLKMPLVTGLAYVSADYSSLTPTLNSAVGFRKITEVSHPRCQKWQLVLENGVVWFAYWFGAYMQWQHLDAHRLRAPGTMTGILQVAKSCNNAMEAILDASAGTIIQGISIGGSIHGDSGQYTYSFDYYGQGVPLVYALPHHVSSFDRRTRDCMEEASLDSQVNGPMTLVCAKSWTMHESLPYGAHLALIPPVRPQDQPFVHNALDQDCQQDFDAGCRADSMYFGGKAMAKLAQVALLTSHLNHPAAAQLMSIFERNLMIYVDNEQQFPLVYDRTWGGLVSSQGFVKDPMADFGNTWYNDKMFHFGYHVFAAAVYLTLAPGSPHISKVCAFAEILLQDYMSPVADTHFPAFRSFDWFVGHSWAKGLFESTDGKDEESSSEDAFATFAAHLYAQAAGHHKLASLTRLMLAVQKRSMNLYMLFENNNTVMPRKIIGNKVSGIRFQNKVDYATYFGLNREFIHGIHMIPLSPVSSFLRSRQFVKEEWAERVRAVSQCKGGWRGILWANYALADAEAAWSFFTSNFDRTHLDDGASHAWYLAFVSSLRI